VTGALRHEMGSRKRVEMEQAMADGVGAAAGTEQGLHGDYTRAGPGA
jgi:hypothetical protein